MYTAQRVDNSWHVTFNGPGMLRASTKRKLLNLIMTNIASVHDLANNGYVHITSVRDGAFVESAIGKIGPAKYATVEQRTINTWEN